MQRKRETSSERYKRRIKQRRIFVLSVFAAVVLLCICLFTPIFGITQISVTGNTLLAAEDVIAASGIEKGENVFRISRKKAEKALASVAYIESAKIKRKFPAKIVIEIDEAKQDIIIDTPQEFVVTTVAGRVLEKTDDVTSLTAPIIYGIEVTKSEPAKKIETSDDEILNMNLERIGCFYETDYWGDIDEFRVSDVSNFIMIMKSGMKVTFGSIDSTESLQRKIKMMAQILPQVQQTEKSYLDLTTDKGYFGEYTDAELEEMRKWEESGNTGIIGGDDKTSGNQTDDSSDAKKSDSDDNSKNDEDSSSESSQKTSGSSAKPSSKPSKSSEPEGDDEDSVRKKTSASPSASASAKANSGQTKEDAKASASSKAKKESGVD